VDGLGCAKVTVFEVIEVPLAQPVKVTIAGAAVAPSQLPAVAAPVPGHEWHELQSWVPGVAKKLL